MLPVPAQPHGAWRLCRPMPMMRCVIYAMARRVLMSAYAAILAMSLHARGVRKSSSARGADFLLPHECCSPLPGVLPTAPHSAICARGGGEAKRAVH